MVYRTQTLHKLARIIVSESNSPRIVSAEFEDSVVRLSAPLDCLIVAAIVVGDVFGHHIQLTVAR
jgi:hypothetical protein